MSKLSRLARHFDDLAGQTVTTTLIPLSSPRDETWKSLGQPGQGGHTNPTFKETKMTLNEFTQAFNAAFTLRQTSGGYACNHDDDSFAFSITIREEELSFGEAMGYGREKERPVIDPVDAIFEACYCDGDSLEEISIYGGNFKGTTDAEQLRNLLDVAFVRDEEQAEDWS